MQTVPLLQAGRSGYRRLCSLVLPAPQTSLRGSAMVLASRWSRPQQALWVLQGWLQSHLMPLPSRHAGLCLFLEDAKFICPRSFSGT